MDDRNERIRIRDEIGKWMPAKQLAYYRWIETVIIRLMAEGKAFGHFDPCPICLKDQGEGEHRFAAGMVQLSNAVAFYSLCPACTQDLIKGKEEDFYRAAAEHMEARWDEANLWVSRWSPAMGLVEGPYHKTAAHLRIISEAAAAVRKNSEPL